LLFPLFYFRIFYFPARGGHRGRLLSFFIAISFCHKLERGTSNRAFLVLHFYFAIYLIYFLLYLLFVFVFFIFSLALLLPVGWFLLFGIFTLFCLLTFLYFRAFF